MRLIWYNIREIIHSQKLLGFLIMFVPFVCTFCVLFAIGIIVNNTYANGENEETLTVELRFLGDRPLYKELEGVVVDAYETLEKGTVSYFCAYTIVKALDESIPDMHSTISVTLASKYEDGIFVPDDSGYFEGNIAEGRRFSAEDFSSEEPRGITVNIPGEYVTIGDQKVAIIGKRVDDTDENLAFPWATVNPEAMRELPVRVILFYLERSLFSEEFQSVIELFDQQFRGQYEVIFSGEAEGDEEAMRATVTLVCILMLIAVGYILVMIYRYVVNFRAYKMAVYQLLGCSKRYGNLLLFGEMMCSITPAVILGVLLFYAFQKTVLADIYPYIDPVFTMSVYVRMTSGILVMLVALCLILSMYYGRHSVKNRLISFKK